MNATKCPNCGLQTGHVRGCQVEVNEPETVTPIPSRSFGWGAQVNNVSPQNDLSAAKIHPAAVRDAEFKRGTAAAASGTYDINNLWLETNAFKYGFRAATKK